MKEFVKRNLILISFSAAGAAGGFFYWKYIGCLSGTCIIKSVWYLSTIYGAILGLILGSLTKDLIRSFKKQKEV